MKIYLVKIIYLFAIALFMALNSIQTGFCCVNPGGICQDSPNEVPKPCCEGENSEQYECKELTAGYFTCEKKESEPPPEE